MLNNSLLFITWPKWEKHANIFKKLQRTYSDLYIYINLWRWYWEFLFNVTWENFCLIECCNGHKTFFGGLIWGEGRIKTGGKICWTYEWDKEFMVNVKWLWKDSLLKNVIFFTYSKSRSAYSWIVPHTRQTPTDSSLLLHFCTGLIGAIALSSPPFFFYWWFWCRISCWLRIT